MYDWYHFLVVFSSYENYFHKLFYVVDGVFFSFCSLFSRIIGDNIMDAVEK